MHPEHYSKRKEQLLKAIKQEHHMITFAFQKIKRFSYGAGMDVKISSVLLMSG